MHEQLCPSGTFSIHHCDGICHFSTLCIRIPMNILALRWNTNSISFCIGIFCRYIFLRGRMLVCFWRSQDCDSLPPVWLDKFTLSFMVCFGSIHRYSFHYTFYLGQNIHSKVWDNQFLYIYSLAFIFYLLITWLQRGYLGNSPPAWQEQNFSPKDFRRGHVDDNFH